MVNAQTGPYTLPMRVSFLLSEAFSIVRKDKLVTVPFIIFFVALGYVEAKGYRFARPVTVLMPSQHQLLYFLFTSLCSEWIVKNVTVAWVGQVLHSGRIVVGFRSIVEFTRTALHLLAALGAVVVPAAVLGVAALSMGISVSKPLIVAVIGLSLILWFLTQFTSQFIIFESDPFWKGLFRSAQFVRDNPWTAMTVFSLGLVVMCGAAMVGALVNAIPTVGPVAFAIVEGVGTTIMISVQTVAFAVMRSKYTTTV
ncbi:hypothetical protein EBR57_05470 [bacterium]|nr:hypothetical protein [bacterium]